MTDLKYQIDALLALNAKGAVSHPVPGLAVELLSSASSLIERLERERDILLQAIVEIAQSDEIDAALDPTRLIRIAGAARRNARALSSKESGNG